MGHCTKCGHNTFKQVTGLNFSHTRWNCSQCHKHYIQVYEACMACDLSFQGVSHGHAHTCGRCANTGGIEVPFGDPESRHSTDSFPQYSNNTCGTPPAMSFYAGSLSW